MRRSVWFAAGAGAGVLVMSRARRIADSQTPEGLSDRWAALSLGVRLFGDEVRAGTTEKETELRERLGLTPHGGTTPQLSQREADH